MAQPSCKVVLADRIATFIRQTVPLRVEDRCYDEALMYARWAQRKLKEGDMDSAIGGLTSAERSGERCKLFRHLK
jgi:hypothetical protein